MTPFLIASPINPDQTVPSSLAMDQSDQLACLYILCVRSNPEAGGGMILWNVNIRVQDYTVSQLRRSQSESTLMCSFLYRYL